MSLDGNFTAFAERLTDLETELTHQETITIAELVRKIVGFAAEHNLRTGEFDIIGRLVAYCHGAADWSDELVCLQAQGWAAGELILLTDDDDEGPEWYDDGS